MSKLEESRLVSLPVGDEGSGCQDRVCPNTCNLPQTLRGDVCRPHCNGSVWQCCTKDGRELQGALHRCTYCTACLTADSYSTVAATRRLDSVFTGEKGTGVSGLPLTYKDSTFHRALFYFPLQVSCFVDSASVRQ